MKRITALSVFSYAALALPAAAQSVADGFYTKGFVELEYVDGSGISETLGYANVDFGIQPTAGGLGFDLGVEALSFSDQREAALYGALSYSGGFGKVQIGVPRTALNDYVDVPSPGGNTLFDLEILRNFDGSVLSNPYLLGVVDAPLGLRYDGTFGATKIGASIHKVDGGGVLDLGANYAFGKTVLRAGLEVLEDGGSHRTSYMLGAESQFGPVNAGILYSNINSFGEVDALQVYATYKPIEPLALTANVVSLDSSGGPNGTLYGLSANYTFYQGAYVEAGVADGEGTDGLYNLSLGLKF